MDECTLNDLLECSVCLERLDTSSKVLPCQHTFCRKCLLEIVHKHKELRCPECRVLVISKVDELPPNVLLMRILEGMRNAGPKKVQRTPRGPTQNVPVHQAQVQQQVSHERKNNNKRDAVLSHQPYAKALYDYEQKEVGDLSFKRGEIVFLKKRIDANWYQGECGGRQGLFPVSYVQIITPLPSHLPQCKALYDFQTDKHEEEGCLVFKEGDIINVIRRVDENWAEGKLNGRVGIFPLSFVELNNLARSLMKLSTNTQPGPSRLAPPTPTTDDSTPLIPIDHTRTIVQQQNPQLLVPSTTSDSSSSTTTTPNVSSSNTSSNSSTAPSSPASPPPRTQQRVSQTGRNSEKRHSFTGCTSSASNATSNRRSVEIVATSGDDIKLPAPYMALYPYRPQKGDELELRKNAVYMVTERCQDGWFKGTANRTQKCGVFPGNYVTPLVTDPKTSVSARGERGTSAPPPELPPRAASPNWQDHVIVPIGRNGSGYLGLGREAAARPMEKQCKDRKEKAAVGLMRRLTSIKRSKSPPASSYSMDNPVFEDTVSVTTTPVHVRSGSCPSQLLQVQPVEHHRLFNSTSQRLKHKERPSVLTHSIRSDNQSSVHQHQHRKSNSLDAGNRSKTGVLTVQELFRCEIPYPPNSEYELELQKGDLIYVHKKRDDGWYKGTQERTGKTGLFPASFVKPA